MPNLARVQRASEYELANILTSVRLVRTIHGVGEFGVLDKEGRMRMSGQYVYIGAGRYVPSHEVTEYDWDYEHHCPALDTVMNSTASSPLLGLSEETPTPALRSPFIIEPEEPIL